MFVITLILHYIIGLGILRRLGFRGTRWEFFGLAFPIGLGTGTLIVFLMDVFGITLTMLSTSIAFLGIGSILVYPEFSAFKGKGNRLFSFNFRGLEKISFAEWIFLIAIFAIYIISFWRCFYLPVTSYDSIVGIDLVAKYGAEEGRIDSRMFNDLKNDLSTQPYYAPFTALSQIIYRLSGHPSGQIWLSFMFLSLITVFYIGLRQEIHPILAGFLTVMLITIPELYAYTFLLQTDFPNAVFVSLSVIYAYQFIKKKEWSYFWVSSILFGFGAWSRSETIVFTAITSLLIFLYIYKDKNFNPYKMTAIFFLIGFVFFGLWNLYYLPEVLNYAPESYFKFGFWDSERLSIIWNGMLGILTETTYWGYVFYFFIFTAIINIIFLKDRNNLFILLWITLIFFGFLILLYHLQLNLNANINYTFRRGSFKLWPIMIYYAGTSYLFKKISGIIEKLETN